MLQFSPNLVAGADINPFRICKVFSSSTVSFAGAPATAVTDYVCGVTDGSTRRFDATAHALAATSTTVADPISLQPSNCVQLEAGAAITNAGTGLMPTTGGKAITAATTGTIPMFVSLEPAAADGVIFWAYRLPATRGIA
jgi:hypothetical protein